MLSPSNISDSWLSEQLVNAGLPSGTRVATVREKSRAESENSSTYNLEIEYSADPEKRAPKDLFLKTSGPDNNREVEFYSVIAPAMSDQPVPRCYYAEYDEETRHSSLLLEDLSQTHRTWDYPIPPTREEAESMVDTLAAIHAFWWDHRDLGFRFGEFATDDLVHGYVREVKTAYTQMADFLGDRLSPSRRRIYDMVFDRHPDLMVKRGADHRHLTFVHGDASKASTSQRSAAGEMRNTTGILNWRRRSEPLKTSTVTNCYAEISVRLSR